MEAPYSNNGIRVDNTYTLYFPINITELLGFNAIGYEIENTNNSQILFYISGSETSSSIKIQAYRIISEFDIPYARFLLISH